MMMIDHAVAAYIERAAEAHGISPAVAIRVARSEGLGHPYAGDHGTSFGPFQLHYRTGLGEVFTRVTGLDASNPGTWQAQVDFTMAYASKYGWGAWHGTAAARRAQASGDPNFRVS